MKKISINITNNDYKITKKSPYSQREIYEKGIQLITNTNIDQILKKQELTKNREKIKYQIEKHEFELKQLNTQLTEITKELDNINKEKIEHIITHDTVKNIQEYQHHSNYQRGLNIIKQALKLSKLPLADFIILKEDYILRVCENNSLDKDKWPKFLPTNKKQYYR